MLSSSQCKDDSSSSNNREERSREVGLVGTISGISLSAPLSASASASARGSWGFVGRWFCAAFFAMEDSASEEARRGMSTEDLSEKGVPSLRWLTESVSVDAVPRPPNRSRYDGVSLPSSRDLRIISRSVLRCSSAPNSRARSPMSGFSSGSDST